MCVNVSDVSKCFKIKLSVTLLTRALDDFAESSRSILTNYWASGGLRSGSAPKTFLSASTAIKGRVEGLLNACLPSLQRDREEKWGHPRVISTSQLLHVIRRGVKMREEEEEAGEVKEDTTVCGHLCKEKS